MPSELTRAVEEYSANCRAVAPKPCVGGEEESALIGMRVEAEPGSFLAFCQGDIHTSGTCIRCHTQVRLLDVDCSGFRRALIEGLAGRLIWGVRRGEIAPIALVDAAIARIERLNP
jgi:hypothetical protein